MAKFKENTIVKICIVLVFSVIFTTAAFAGGLAIAMGQAGLYDKSYEELQTAMLSSECYSKAADIQGNVNVTETKNKKKNEKNKLKIDVSEIDDDGYDFVVEYDGKVIYEDTEKDAEYISSAVVDVWVGTDNQSSTVLVKCYMKNAGNAQIFSWQKDIKSAYDNRNLFIIIAAIGMLISIILFALMMMGAGRREEDEEIHVRGIDKLPHDIYFILASGAICGMIASGIEIMGEDLKVGIIASYFMGIACMLIFSAFTMSAAVQLKKKQLLKKTVCGRIILAIIKGVKAGAVSIPLVWKTVAGAIILAVFNLILVAVAASGGGGIAVAFSVLTGILLVACVWYLSIGLNKLKKGAENIAAGNAEYRVDTAKMLPSMKQHGENINSINEAVTRAVDEQMKSERFKTELITNVSHDIKTPLTSIINYTDLLIAEDIDNETAREYIGIIAKHAARLKKLTVDVVDASKASTGNVKVKLAKISIGMMAEQVFGEYREKIEEKGLRPILSISEENIEVMADGNHMGRVLDNVLSNICKYAQEGTRVYMDVFRKNDRAFVVFKNISSQELNITPDELMERFVRGDESRNSEGSGLGLNIASSLMRLQGGDFNISIDGDLFKTEISMPIA